MAWLLLALAIVVDIAATAAIGRTEGFRHPAWTAGVLGAYALSVWLFALAVRTIEVPVAYAVMTGLGTAGIALAGVVFLGTRLDAVTVTALAMVVGGVVLLNLHTA